MDQSNTHRGVNKMVSALNVSNNILNRAFACDVDVTPMKLQKLLYFVYKRYLQTTGKRLFNEDFEVWKYGPVVRSVYDEFRSYHSNAIRTYYTEGDGTVLIGNESENQTFREALDYVWDNYGNFDGLFLSKLTHRHGTAWSKAVERNDNYLLNEDIMREPFDECKE